MLTPSIHQDRNALQHTRHQSRDQSILHETYQDQCWLVLREQEASSKPGYLEVTRLVPWQDMARVARWMAGKAVGLVLSGGGSRGLAHLGVLHALDDAGVPVDVIGGTSQVASRSTCAQDAVFPGVPLGHMSFLTAAFILCSSRS